MQLGRVPPEDRRSKSRRLDATRAELSASGTLRPRVGRSGAGSSGAGSGGPERNPATAVRSFVRRRTAVFTGPVVCRREPPPRGRHRGGPSELLRVLCLVRGLQRCARRAGPMALSSAPTATCDPGSDRVRRRVGDGRGHGPPPAIDLARCGCFLSAHPTPFGVALDGASGRGRCRRAAGRSR